MKFVKFFKNALFYRTSPVAAADIFRFRQRSFSVNFANFLTTSFDRTPPDDCFLCLSVNFMKFFRRPFS